MCVCVSSDLGERAYAEFGEELVLVQHVAEDLQQSLLAGDGQQVAELPIFQGVQVGDLDRTYIASHRSLERETERETGAHLFSKVLSVVEEPLQPLPEPWQFLDDLVLQYQAGIERDETYHRLDLHRKTPPIWQPGCV